MAQLHIGIDAQTLQIRAIAVTSVNVRDASVIPDLLENCLQIGYRRMQVLWAKDMESLATPIAEVWCKPR